jgi:hypothetical protein
VRKARLFKRTLLRVGIFLILFSELINTPMLFAYQVISVKEGGELMGTIKFKGVVPFNRSHQVINNTDFCGSTVQEETFLVNQENQGLENVVISVEDAQRGKKPIISNLVIENRHCRFFPHVQAGMVGNSFEIRNMDPILHNSHFHMEGLTLINVAMPPGGKNIKKPFLQAGIINAKCDAHQFMQGWILVENSPYVAVTDKEGNYKITDIPPGKYKIKIWHEGVPGKEKEVTILPDKKTELSLDLTLR